MPKTLAKPAQHTPGPWHADATLDMQDSDCYFRPIFDDNDTMVAKVIVGTEDGTRGGTRVATAEEDAIEGEANARLIAAAPDLLAALRDLTDWGCTYTSPLDANSPHGLLIAARVAIAKATGGA